MRLRLLQVSLLAAFTALVLPTTLLAQESCPEGRTAGGQCVNPSLAATMRMDSIIFSQSQLSQTAQPIMPQLDYRYRYPHQLTTTPPQAALTPTPPAPTTIVGPCFGEGC